MNPEKGVWLYLWDGDSKTVRRFTRGLHEMGVTTSGLIVVPKGHQPPTLEWMPKGWSIGMNQSVGSAEWIGLIWPDCCAEVAGWDIKMVNECQPCRVIASNSFRIHDWRLGCFVFGMEFIKVLGGLDPMDIRENEMSNWIEAAKRSGTLHVRNDAQIVREHPPTSPVVPFDEKYVIRFTSRLTALREKYGERQIVADYTNVRLQIATPTHSGRPEAVYQTSKDAMVQHSISHGFHLEFSREMYNADIGLARARLLGEFLLSNCTHCLMIDDDMGWQPSAVDRLIYANKPIVAVAGPKKSYPLKFAASHIDVNNNPIPIVMDPMTGTAEVSLVGCAFMMITRQAAQAMVDYYPELKYYGNDGKETCGLFTQFVRDHRYYSEDFGFCQRWRDMGGKLYICPDVSLQHCGVHVYEGSLMGMAVQQGNVRAA